VDHLLSSLTFADSLSATIEKSDEFFSSLAEPVDLF